MNIYRSLALLAAIALSFQISRADDTPPTVSRDYTAELEITSASSPTPIKCTMYVGLTKIRKDTTIGNVEMKIFMDLPKLVLVSRMPETTPLMTEGLPTDGVWKNLGSDTVNGVSCQKFEFTDAATHKVTDYWFNGNNYVQTGTPDGSEKVVYTSFVPGEPDPSVFDLDTTGYKVIRMNKPSSADGIPQTGK
jgi:hypothetical protein